MSENCTNLYVTDALAQLTEIDRNLEQHERLMRLVRKARPSFVVWVEFYLFFTCVRIFPIVTERCKWHCVPLPPPLSFCRALLLGPFTLVLALLEPFMGLPVYGLSRRGSRVDTGVWVHCFSLVLGGVHPGGLCSGCPAFHFCLLAGLVGGLRLVWWSTCGSVVTCRGSWHLLVGLLRSLIISVGWCWKNTSFRV